MKLKKSETLEIRLPYPTKLAFMARCQDEGVSASEALRGFIEREIAPPAPRIGRRGWRLVAGGIIAATVGAAAVGAVAAPALAHPAAAGEFARLDTDHDGRLGAAELRALDTDGDGAISFAEYRGR
ncbi:MAG: EF-hand domain-containing protein [Phenylobacterium sp.]|uniref:EF-hand domain-containing protein n=1 Tax=Phenylobacterium sp. TaxID=1871053 RepID=UPI001A5A5166|nr:EF-hand domain-containing protein [Phenylobacterium sp.]MBL8554482.1 EF-hand domain-containing protein [Phenylobacterium sp.]